jgi:cell division protease FtsH
MSERLGLATCAQRQPAFWGAQEFQTQRDCSEQTAREIDEEVRAILAQAYDDAKDRLRTSRDKLELITAELLQHESMDGPTFYGLAGREMPRPKELVPPIPELEDVPGASPS